MTLNEQISAATEFAELWHALMPDLETPDREQFLIWVGRYSPEVVTRGINRTAGKVRKLRYTAEPMTANAAMKYASSVMRHEFYGTHTRPTIPVGGLPFTTTQGV